MILKSYLKKNSIVLTPREQSLLGRRVAKSFFDRNPTVVLNKVKISSNGIKMEVFDYPRTFFDDNLERLVNKFLASKHKSKRSESNV